MPDEIISEFSNWLQWYQTIYGNEIRYEGAFNFNTHIHTTPQVNTTHSPPIQAAPTTVKPQANAIQEPAKVSEKVLENSYLVHQDDPTLKGWYEEIKGCTQCGLAAKRNHFVFGMGNPKADIMFVGEAPGRDEDLKGLPFVGMAGKLLDKMLFALGIQREQVYIANVIKCRPPNNRDPQKEEVDQCEPYLLKQIDIIQPKVIIALGRIAAQALLKTEAPLSKLRTTPVQYNGTPLIVTYHPAAMLRNPNFKAQTWLDLKKIQPYLT